MIQIAKCTSTEFQSWIDNGRKVICFCAGKGLLNLCNRYKMEANIIYAVDNHKHGTIIDINGYRISIIKPEDISDEEIKDSILIITTMRFIEELIPQLDSIAELDDRYFYIPDLFEKDKISGGQVLKGGNEQYIPKKIHYCWFGKSEMPKQFRDNILSWEKNCPDYEIIRWDESNYDIEKNLYMKQAYEAKKWGFVPDYARLDIINSQGGVYLDTDVEILRPLDELLYFDFFCGFESEKYVALGLGFGAKSNCKILQDMMSTYEKIHFVNDDGTLNLVASPIYQTNMLKEYGVIMNGETQIIGESIVLAPEYLAPINDLGVGSPTVNSFSIHQYAATWLNKEQKEEHDKVVNLYKWIYGRMS